MRSIFTALLFAGIICLSSCSTKDDASANVLVVPSSDSVTKNSDIKIVFSNTDSVEVHDLVVKNLPIETLFASNTYNPADSTNITRIVLTDNTSKLISLNLTVNNTSMTPLGTTYYVTSNSSTLTDFRAGENKTYAIGSGSNVIVTQAIYPISGTMSLNLHYNMTTIFVTGTFSIYR